MSKENEFGWEVPKHIPKTEPEHGDLRVLKLPVKVIFEWSDKIVSQVDEENNPVEYTSGYIMKVLGGETFVYKGEESQYIASTMQESNCKVYDGTGIPVPEHEYVTIDAPVGGLVLSPLNSEKECEDMFIEWMKDTFDKDVKIT